MKDGEHTRQELKGISPLLAGISNNMLNEIPDGYFNDLSERILAKILENPVYLPAIQLPFSAPVGYFESLPHTILKKIKAGNAGAEEMNRSEELDEIAPILAFVSKRNVYSVDENYFDKWKWDFVSSKEKSPAKIISFPQWAQYLVAASVFVIIAISAVFYVGNKSLPAQAGNSFAEEVQKLPDSAITDYLQSAPVYSIGVNTPVNQQLDVNSLLYNISDQQIEEYLDDTKDISTPPGRNI